MKNFSPGEGPTLEKFVEDYLQWVGPHTGAGEEYAEEEAVETMHDELTVTPVPCPLATLRGRSYRSQG